MSTKLTSTYLSVMARLQQWKEAAVDKVKEALTDETGDVNVVAIVVLIGIAVVLAIFFREQITGILTTLFGTISDNAGDAIENGG